MQYPDDEEIEAIDQQSDRSCASKRDRADFMSACDARGSTASSHVKYRKAVSGQGGGGARRDAFFIPPRESSVYEGVAVLDSLSDTRPATEIPYDQHTPKDKSPLHAPAPDVFDAVPIDRLDDALDQVRETGAAPHYVESWYRKLKQEEHRT